MHAEIHVSFHVKCLLFLFEFKQNLHVLTNVSKPINMNYDDLFQ
jgi:hypothetical protein